MPPGLGGLVVAAEKQPSLPPSLASPSAARGIVGILLNTTAPLCSGDEAGVGEVKGA